MVFYKNLSVSFVGLLVFKQHRLLPFTHAAQGSFSVAALSGITVILYYPFNVNIFKIYFFHLNISLKYPPFDVRLKKQGQQTFIFDIIRKKWLVLTPEEWVRQHLLHYLVKVKNFASSTISVEKEIVLNDLRRRYDVVVYNRELKPYLIVECKAPYIELNQQVVDQALRYNLTIKAELLMITNGVSDLVFNARNEVIELPQQT
jgi:hypothetical protein